REQKPAEELFDCLTDPHELHDLADDPRYADKLDELRTEMDRWLVDIGDDPTLPERELIDQLWHGGETQPTTAAPSINGGEAGVELSCATPGASLGYRFASEGIKPGQGWQVYQGPIMVSPGDTLRVQAHRLGFVPSQVVEWVAGR
ncbi:MAG: sulfatase, partial [Bacteroidota bacterium]